MSNENNNLEETEQSGTVGIYAVYLTTATETQVVGTVVNRIVWDGETGWVAPEGQDKILDNSGKYPIGSIYTVTS